MECRSLKDTGKGHVDNAMKRNNLKLLTNNGEKDKEKTPKLQLVAQPVMRPSTVRETWVRSLGREDPLEKGMAIHSSTIAWRIPWTEEPGKLSLRGRKESDTTE